MSYTVLYREFRPKRFSEIVGQDNIVSILKNQIIKDKISHAYLFSGIRGTGKTSTAKVFAKSICCLDSRDGEACGVCASCRDIQEGSASDIIEIDAASNRGINEIRELKENVGYMPSFGKYRVYIIDEVHMLTPEAFNALLKTLEEPPEHIVFIFATTESNRILPTILSRCQRFDFARIDHKTVVNHLKGILEKKNIEYEPKALDLIALNTEGAMRDALSLLDKAISVSSEEKVSEENVNEILGLIGDGDIQTLAGAVLDRDVNTAINSLDGFLKKGREPASIISQLIEYYSNKIIAINADNPERIINKSSEYIKSLTESHATLEDSQRISDMIYSLSKLRNDMRFFSDPQFVVTAKIINLCIGEKTAEGEPVQNSAPQPGIDRRQMELVFDRINALEKEVDRLRSLEGRVEKLSKGRPPVIGNLKAEEKEPVVKSVEKKSTRPVVPSSGIIRIDRAEIKEFSDNFDLMISYIKNRGEGLIGAIAEKFVITSVKNGVVTVYPGESLDMMDIFRSGGGERVFREALKARMKKNYEVEYIDRKVVLKYEGEAPRKSRTDGRKKEVLKKALEAAPDEEYYRSMEQSLPEEESAEAAEEMPDFDDSIKEIFMVKE